MSICATNMANSSRRRNTSRKPYMSPLCRATTTPAPPPVANDSAPAVTENRAHSATADTAHPNAERDSNFADDDVVSDEDEISHLAAALNASTTDAITAAPMPKVHYSCDGPVNGTIADHVRPAGPSDKIRAKNAKFWDDESDDGDTSGDSDFGDEHSERNHPTALIANGKRPRTVIRTKKYWLQKAVPKHGWRKRQAREAHLAEELALPDSSGSGRDIAAGSTTVTDNDDATTGQETGPAEVRVALVFRRRLIQPELRNAVAEPASDEGGTPDMGGDSGSVCREEQFSALSDFEGNSSSDGSEASLAPDAGKAGAGGTGARPLRKLKLTWRSRAFRRSLYTGSNCTASACTIEGCGRLPRIQYTERRTKALMH